MSISQSSIIIEDAKGAFSWYFSFCLYDSKSVYTDLMPRSVRNEFILSSWALKYEKFIVELLKSLSEKS